MVLDATASFLAPVPLPPLQSPPEDQASNMWFLQTLQSKPLEGLWSM